ncbi:alpha-ribazole phosphatase [Pseudocnuella soli]|uniref:alpha-ribazole phosphatase n=1 Tax=Pseudocnuella soli TaxID=2502779 RepID=UPI00104FE96F|nr:alpha-ribazole phosphatase [Pseudocnuella soli]
MMELYLIRHTTPAVASGICYGQADLDVTDSFATEAGCISKHLPAHIAQVYSSPLQRCRKLAEHLFPQHNIRFDDRLKEINCGNWELSPWESIEAAHLQHWTDNLADAVIPEGESYRQLYHRVAHFYDQLPKMAPVAVVTHGGVIRSMLAHMQGVDILDSFEAFQIRYGCTIRVVHQTDGHQYEYLHNPDTPHETHRPRHLRPAKAGF